MAIYQDRRWLFERPQAATFLLITANIFVFGLCLRHSNATAIWPDVLFLNGAMYSHAIERHEYWRLIAHAFLHANLIHLATNMFCLALWGGLLEKRVGSFYFLTIYLCSMIAGAVVSDLHHSQPYLAVGASGAISGVLGALLCLWILDKIDLSANFFLVNIGLNAAVAMSSPRIDWAAHLGGFAAGLIICTLIDIFERLGRFAFRCKFPEFVKVNGFILGATLGVLMWSDEPAAPGPGSVEGWFPLLAYTGLGLAAIKLVDLLLSLKKGLAIIVVAFSVANAGSMVLAGEMAPSLPGCASPLREGGGLVGTLVYVACSNRQITIAIFAACVLGATLLLYSQELVRGIKDVGFVGASLRAERERRQGI